MSKYGFIEVSRSEVRDIGATLVEYRHEKCGTKLLHIEREDPNRTFMISFKTPPKNDTGVFHIIEHSVLCGSKKFPMKEPFLELLKGSMNTFLNAMTYPDKTVYPVCSINDKDFLNLVDVYMDAVLNPAFYENESIFMQEGHHREITEEGELIENGVVFNEMKGAFSSADEIEMQHMMRLLFPGTPYEKCSGGAPEAIPELTYEEFLNTHREHYHPSGAYIILDGSIRVEEVFPLIDKHLCAFDRAEVKIDIAPLGKRAGATVKDYYAVGEDDTTQNKTRLSLALGGFDFDEKRKNMALTLIKSVIAEDNSSVFSKRILDSGLCEDVSLYTFDSMKYGANALSLLNVKDGAEDELTALAIKTLRDIAGEGLDKGSLRSALSAMEFRTRESDYGTLPIGIIYSLTVMESWLYSDDFSRGLKYEEDFKALRELIDTDYYDELLLSVIPKEDEVIRVILYPSATAEAEADAKERELLRGELQKMSEEQKRELNERCDKFRLWQTMPDTPEALRTLPTLSVSDISSEAKKPVIESREAARPALSVPIHTNGITYVSLLFDALSLSEEECTLISIASALLTRVDTETHTALELKNLIKGELGYFNVAPLSTCDKGLNPLFYIKVGVGVTANKRMKCVDIIKEVLRDTLFPAEDVKRVVLQMALNYKQSVIADGTELAINRVQARYDRSRARQEHISGYESYQRISAYAERVDDVELWQELSQKLRELATRLFVKANLTVAIGGEYDSELADAIISSLPDGESQPPYEIKTLPTGSEGAAIPTKVSYAVTGMPMPLDVSSDIKAVRGIVEFEYLWGEIRTTGGAYGTGEILRDGFVGFYSYRDPSPERSLQKYREIPKFLREFARELNEPLDKYIISTVARLDAPKTPRLRFEVELMQRLCGISYEHLSKNRKEILSANRNSILKFADILEQNMDKSSTCAVSSRDILEHMPHLSENIIEIN